MKGGRDEGGPERIGGRNMLMNTEFSECPDCRRYKLKVKQSKKGSLFVACTGFASGGCRLTMNLPNCLEHITMLGDKCGRCRANGRDVNLFKLDFYTEFVNEQMTESLPFDDNTSGNFCIFKGCDQNLQKIIELTFRLPTKPAGSGSAATESGVP